MPTSPNDLELMAQTDFVNIDENFYIDLIHPKCLSLLLTDKKSNRYDRKG